MKDFFEKIEKIKELGIRIAELECCKDARNQYKHVFCESEKDGIYVAFEDRWGDGFWQEINIEDIDKPIEDVINERIQIRDAAMLELEKTKQLRAQKETKKLAQQEYESYLKLKSKFEQDGKN